jgi:hypothetical protein
MNGSRRIPTDEAAAYIGEAPSTLNKRRLSSDGPPFLKISRRVVYDTADLDTWLASKRRNSTSDHGATSVPA